MKRRRVLHLACCGLALPWAAGADQPRAAPSVARAAPTQPAAAAGSTPATTFGGSATLRAALRDELARALRQLSLPELPKPYLISATVFDQVSFSVTATLGSIQSTTELRSRMLRVDVRVGDYAFDNSNFMGAAPTGMAEPIAFEDDYWGLRRASWRLIDQGYKAATSDYEAKRAQRRSEAQDEQRPPSFARAEPRQSVVEPTAAAPPARRCALLAERLSAVFREFPQIQQSGVVIVAAVTRRSFVSTEGAEIVEPGGLAGVCMWAATQAPDGMQLVNHALAYARDGRLLPPQSELLTAARNLATELVELRQAPLLEQYSGPVLFEGEASAQLLDHLLANQLSGTPPPESPSGQLSEENAVAGRVGWPVLPRGFALVDDPTLERYAGSALIGGYRYDEEGVAGQRVQIVDDGKLVALLMSRTPSKEFGTSNGHARHSFVGASVGGPSNLLLLASRGLSRRALRARLRREVVREGLPYGLVVRRLEEPAVAALATLQGGQHRAFSGLLPDPILVTQLLPDGTERLVRGAYLQSLETRDLRDILAAGATAGVYHSGARALLGALHAGVGAGSATSIVTPDLLLRRAGLRAQAAPYRRLPVLPRPDAD